MPKKTFMLHVRIVDGVRDTAIEDGAFVIQRVHTDKIPIEDHIVYAGPMEGFDYKAMMSDGDVVLDLSGGTYTVMPGLFNVHAHLDLRHPYKPYRFDEFGTAYRTMIIYRRAVEALNAGVTTIRSTGLPDEIDYAVKKADEAGMLQLPRLVVCGRLNIAVGGHAWNNYISQQFNGADEFRMAARKELARGADFIKIGLTGGAASAHEGMGDKQMTDEEIAAVVEVAHNAGKKVAAHLGGDKAIQDAIRLGVDSVEHAYTLSDETAQKLVEAGAYLVPTLSVTNCTDYLRGHGSPDFQIRKLEESAAEHRRSIARAVKAGAKICVGTDLLPSDPIDGTVATIREIELLTEVGLTPMQALKAATSNSAELCGVDDVTGTLEPGKAGDFIVVEGRPDKNIRDVRNIRQVVRNCRLVWSDLPQLKLRRLQITPDGMEMDGGTYRKW